MINDKIFSKLRREYNGQGLDEKAMNPDPFLQFETWFKEIIEVEDPQADIMSLASSTKDGRPSVRILLLKHFDHRGFVFYTNYESRKAKEFEQNPQVAACFYWARLERQVRIEGTVEKISEEDSEAYFQSRPRNAQIAAWSSDQSESLKSREDLEKLFLENEKKFSKEKNIPLPPFWGGYRLVPNLFEFWMGMESRLNERITYALEEDLWVKRRLFP